MVPKGIKVTLAHKDHKVFKVNKVYKVLKVIQASKALRGILENKDQLVLMVIPQLKV